jgi:hypothetical protein
MEDKSSEQHTTSVKLEIELGQDGQLSVRCPVLGDTLFCLGLLEMAKASVFQFKANQSNQSKVILPKQHGIMDFIRKRF